MSGERLDAIIARLAEGASARHSMPVWGRLHVDRQLPFLVVYRKPAKRPDPGTDRLVVGGASFLQASAVPGRHREIAALVERIATHMAQVYGTFLIVEVWSGGGDGTPEGETPSPAYTVIRPRGTLLAPTVQELLTALGESQVARQPSHVSEEIRTAIAPPGMRPLLTAAALERCGACLLGLEVSPVYRTPAGDLYPALVRQVARRVTTALARAFYRFTRTRTTARPAHYHQLGRRAVVKAVFDVDARLADVAARFELLLQVTPVNAEQSFSDFRRSGFERAPHFDYRPLTVDPGRLKQRLWSVRPERVEDPTLMHLFRGAQFQLDRQLTMLSDVGRTEFLHESLQLYGGVEPGLLAIAEQALEVFPPSRRRPVPTFSAEEFRALAAAEVHSYRSADPGFGTLPQVRDDIYAGLLVSHGRLFVGAEARLPCSRADALIQHEIGTHMVTHHNGSAQPLRLLSEGLPGYDELQEGLAVLGEYLVGGLDPERMRVLAARVVAVHALTTGAEFVETFRLMTGYGFSRHAAFTLTTRVYRGGGLTKDAMYLRGLVGILDYVAEGCDFGRFFLGKYSADQIPIIEELLLRNVLTEPALLPRYLERDDAKERLARVRMGMSVVELVGGADER